MYSLFVSRELRSKHNVLLRSCFARKIAKLVVYSLKYQLTSHLSDVHLLKEHMHLL